MIGRYVYLNVKEMDAIEELLIQTTGLAEGCSDESYIQSTEQLSKIIQNIRMKFYRPKNNKK